MPAHMPIRPGAQYDEKILDMIPGFNKNGASISQNTSKNSGDNQFDRLGFNQGSNYSGNNNNYGNSGNYGNSKQEGPQISNGMIYDNNSNNINGNNMFKNSGPNAISTGPNSNIYNDKENQGQNKITNFGKESSPSIGSNSGNNIKFNNDNIPNKNQLPSNNISNTPQQQNNYNRDIKQNDFNPKDDINISNKNNNINNNMNNVKVDNNTQFNNANMSKNINHEPTQHIQPSKPNQEIKPPENKLPENKQHDETKTLEENKPLSEPSKPDKNIDQQNQTQEQKPEDTKKDETKQDEDKKQTPESGPGKVGLTVDLLASAIYASGFSPPDNDTLQKIVDAINKEMESLNEAAMFIAQCIHESGGFNLVEEIKCKDNPDACVGEYNSPLGVPGQSYHGRGYIQLSWPENYLKAGEGIGMGDELLKNPGLVASNPDIAIKTAIWFWKEIVRVAEGVKDNHFGATTKAINGPLECGTGSETPAKRYGIYKKVAEVLSITDLADESGC
ncbi:hypothetical protein EDEG_02924 [Edhazardia aedis USNM 41457]|uniref:Glycoside hydrolase family 19 catalytic domain-containing protein n=1 Tax=Edhazardia aedis (strain USNM 41457) TaxID=1003232 RepID=J9DMW9_EDHAE|nr:hypothetical protein EDEG_02924 [Edhazardia aedis USNM 41457]|eukprot:EJW02692.1 hypothetical protein EDEG_02924 [Edhazardia aedis USNM 41457]